MTMPTGFPLEMLKLVIGNKNYSSWSMRPWLALRANEIPFEEVFVPLYTDDKADKDRILSFSRAGKVPALIDGDVTVWDSLSIIEYLAEKFPQARLWPEDRARRAHARSISAEMHSGFMPLRNECGMNLHRPVGAIDLSDDARANVARVQAGRARALRSPRHSICRPAELSYIGKGGLNIGQGDSREPQELRLIALKNMRNLRICHASMLLAFGGPAVL